MASPKSYQEFLSMVQHHETSNLTQFLDAPTVPLLKSLRMPKHHFPGTYILDYTKSKYIAASQGMESVSGYRSQSFLEGGLDFTTQIWHNEDAKIFSDKVHSTNLKFLQEIPTQQHGNYLFTCNYRIRTRFGGFRNILQQSVFLQSAETGEPLATMGCITDISSLRMDGRVTHTVEPITENGLGEPVISNVYYARPEDGLLSTREVEIVKCICEGLSSAEIAKKLFISVYTVNNHRQHIMQKTNSRNVADVIKYAIRQGWL
ncbi:hypothetical protein COR50_01135 [Chitinophaga caeni]|uniref:HTH luxR-type domain-containing protein n=1 Tax=Chitinophaga caeni TaxID=2029983 RepID=A0A291QPN1_9BACT|nr:response regulator transcription factor [Chitinophaga caeni]ATL45875.1 hypothetical protein COR50_01135 [Chitinophaga caeni]